MAEFKSFEEKLKSKIDKFKKSEESKPRGRGFVEDPNKFPMFSTGDVIYFRLIPPKPVLEDKDVDFYKTFYFHSYFTAKNKNKREFFVCPKNLSWDHSCKFCDFVADTYKAFGSNDDYKNYKRKKTHIFCGYLVSFKNDTLKDDDNHVQAWKKCLNQVRMIYFPFSVKNKITDELDDSGSFVFNPFEGYDLIVKVVAKKDGENVYNDYSLTKFSKNKTAILDSNEEIEKLLEKSFNISENIEERVISEQEMIKLAIKEAIIVTDDETSLDSTIEQSYETEADVPIENTSSPIKEKEEVKEVEEKIEEVEAKEDAEEDIKEDVEEDVDEIIKKLNNMFEE